MLNSAIKEADCDEPLGGTSDDDASCSTCHTSFPYGPDRAYRSDPVADVVLGRVIEARCWHRAHLGDSLDIESAR
jgi:hypothetical protein